MMNPAVVNRMEVVMVLARFDQDLVHICMSCFLSLRQLYIFSFHLYVAAYLSTAECGYIQRDCITVT